MEEKTLFPREEKSEILFKKISEDKWACEKLMETFCSYLFSNDGVDLPDSPSSTEFAQALFNSYRNRDLSAFLMAICQNTVFDLLRNVPNIFLPRAFLGSIPFTACSITLSGCVSSILSSLVSFRPPVQPEW